MQFRDGRTQHITGPTSLLPIVIAAYAGAPPPSTVTRNLLLQELVNVTSTRINHLCKVTALSCCYWSDYEISEFPKPITRLMRPIAQLIVRPGQVAEFIHISCHSPSFTSKAVNYFLSTHCPPISRFRAHFTFGIDTLTPRACLR